MSKIFYVIGPSGSGKDSIISGLEKRLDPESGLRVADRYITRPCDAGDENHIALTEEEFDLQLSTGFFSMNWEANGFKYGIAQELDASLQAGLSSLVNGSREYLPKALEKYGDTLLPVLITVDEGRLEQRLLERGRESAEQIDARLMRNNDMNESLNSTCQFIDNSADLESAIAQLERLIDEHSDTARIHKASSAGIVA